MEILYLLVNMTEKELYLRMKAGEIDAFNQLFKMHYEPLVKSVYKKCYNQVLAEDIVQGIFIEFWSKKEERIIKNSVGAYLSTSVRNRYIDHFRKQKKTNKKETDYANHSLHLDIESPEEALITKENIANIYSKIAALPLKSKSIFLLSRFEDKTYPEIAEELNISVKTVEYHISNALKLLRKSIFLLLIHIS